MNRKTLLTAFIGVEFYMAWYLAILFNSLETEWTTAGMLNYGESKSVIQN